MTAEIIKLLCTPEKESETILCRAQLRNILADRFEGLPCVITSESLGFLEGLRAAEVSGVGAIIDALKKYKRVTISHCKD